MSDDLNGLGRDGMRSLQELAEVVMAGDGRTVALTPDEYRRVVLDTQQYDNAKFPVKTLFGAKMIVR